MSVGKSLSLSLSVTHTLSLCICTVAVRGANLELVSPGVSRFYPQCRGMLEEQGIEGAYELGARSGQSGRCINT